MWTTKKLVRNCPAPAPGSVVGPLPVLLLLLLLLLCSGSLQNAR